MDISTQAEVLLRESGYLTWPWSGASPPVTCFENQTLVGFIHVFNSAAELLQQWKAAEHRVLARHALALKAAGAKSWNVYSVFLTPERQLDLQNDVERIEENFSLTRKLARTSIQAPEDLANVLLPLLRLKYQPLLENIDFSIRLRSRAKDIPQDVLTAFLGDAKPEEIARILGRLP